MRNFTNMKFSNQHWYNLPGTEKNPHDNARYLKGLRARFAVQRTGRFNCWTMSSMLTSPAPMHSDGWGQMDVYSAFWIACLKVPVPKGNILAGTQNPLMIIDKGQGMYENFRCEPTCVNPYHKWTQPFDLYEKLLKRASIHYTADRLGYDALMKARADSECNWCVYDRRAGIPTRRPRATYVEDTPPSADRFSGRQYIVDRKEINNPEGYEITTPLRPLEVSLYWYLRHFRRDTEAAERLLSMIGITQDSKSRAMLLDRKGYVDYTPVPASYRYDGRHIRNGLRPKYVLSYSMNVAEMFSAPPYIPMQHLQGRQTPWYWRPMHIDHSHRPEPKKLRV